MLGMYMERGRKKKTHHQRPGMQAHLVFWALKVVAAQRENSPVVIPDENHDDDIKGPGTDDLTPDGVGLYIQRGHASKGAVPTPDACALQQVDRDEHTAADDAHDDEHVPQHASASQEDDGIQANAVDEGFLLGLHDRRYPGEKALSDRRRSMFLVGVFDLGGIDGIVVRSEDGEEQGEDDGDADGGAQRGPESIDLELQ
jgi:hypothetical protein